ncbi:MAG: tRNA1(Val) (adenine(37)-N6)-methyltransferase [Hyphomicrobiaceae bacterium]
MNSDAADLQGADGQAASSPAKALAGMALSEDAFLDDRLLLLQPERGYRAGLDAVLLAAAAPGRGLPGGARVLDAGAGIGTVGLCVARRLPDVQAVLVERNPMLAALAARNIDRNGLAARVRAVESDLLASAAALTEMGLGPETFDVVLANPPYHDETRGTASNDGIKAAAHAMPGRDLDQWARVLARVCRAGGSIVMIHMASALPQVLDAVASRFGEMDVMPVHARAGEPAGRIIVRGTKGSRAPLRLLAGFVVHDTSGAFTPAAEAILRHGAALDWPPRANRRRRG